MRTRDIKARAEELAEGYQEARDDAFMEEFDSFLKENNHTDLEGNAFCVTEDDVQGFLDSFTFPDEADWSFDAVQSELDDVADAKYQQMKDNRC